MATYVTPQVLVFQEFNLATQVELQNLNAFITGPHAFLLRCDNVDEKEQAYIGQYDHVGLNIDGEFKTCYSWPQKPVGSKIDSGYSALCVDNALLRYFRDTSHTMLKSGDNKIRHLSKSFIDNPLDATTYPRAGDFLDRDVQVGDIVTVSGIPTYIPAGSSSSISASRVSLCTYVKAIEADQVASSVATGVSNTNNQADLSAATANSADAGNSGTATITSVDGSSYDGHADGDMAETYTVTVTQSSTAGDATTAKLRVVSASGNDDVAEVTPAAFGAATTVGARGLTSTWAVGSTQFTAGDEWTITVSQAFTAPTSTSGGTFTGLVDLVYEITVTKGGLYASNPEITVITTDGTDFSGPTAVTAAAAAVAVGTKGVTVAFNQTALRKGDKYTIAATASIDGTYRTLVLGHNLDEDIAQDNAASSLLEVDLFIKTDLSVPEYSEVVNGQKNWSQSETEFCAYAGIQVYESSWTSAGVPVALSVIGNTGCANTNQMYLTYRAWRSDLATSVRGIDDIANLDTAVEGPLTPDNPLKWALSKALGNNNGQEVKYMAVTNPDLSSAWITVLDAIEERQDVYGLVPLTKDKTILGLFASHVQAQSNELRGRWRVLWLNLPGDNPVVVVSAAETTDASVLLATTEDDPSTSGTQYTLMKVTSGNIELIVAGVRAGDTVRYQYAASNDGTVSYSEFIIDEVINETTVRLLTGTSVEENTAKKLEIWRTLTPQELSEDIAKDAGNWADRRIRAVWPDKVSFGGTEMEGYHLCAALSALSGGVVPHQGLTNLEIAGFDDLTRTTELFNRSQLDDMAYAGTWIVTQHPRTGEVFTRHAVTTAENEFIEKREETIVRNVDSISYYFLDKFSPYIGISNVTPSMLDIIESETRSGIEYLRSSNYTQRLGGQLIDAEITDLRASQVFKDRIILALSLDIPFPLNNLECHLVI